LRGKKGTGTLLFLVTTIAASSSQIKEASVCDLVERPQQYAGHTVKFVGDWTRTARRILVDDPNGKCGPILVELPDDRDVHPRAHFSVVKDSELKRFLESSYVLIPSAKTHQTGKIRATFQGRFDVARGGKGVGHGNMYDLRLVLQQLSNVSVDYPNQSTGSDESKK
jgi:hypothetical protein